MNSPTEKLHSRHARTLANLNAAIRELPHVLVFDNNDLHIPFRRVAVFENGKLTIRQKPLARQVAEVTITHFDDPCGIPYY